MNKMNWRMNNRSRKSEIITGYKRSGLIRKSGNALIMIVLMFAMLLVLGTGAVTLASSTSRRAINETKKEQAYIAARSVSMAIKDQIVNTTDAAARTAYVTQLKTAVASGSTNLSISGSNNDVSYKLLRVEAVGTNLEKYTVRATYAGVSEDYSFVLLNTPVSTPSSTNAFMNGNNVSAFDYVNIVNNYKDDGIAAMVINGKSDPGQRMNLKSKLEGDVFIHGNVNLEAGFYLDGNLIVDGTLRINTGTQVAVNGNVYVSGQMNLVDGSISGSIFSNSTSSHRVETNFGQANINSTYFYSNSASVVTNLSSKIVVENINSAVNSSKLNDYVDKMEKLGNLLNPITPSYPAWAEWKEIPAEWGEEPEITHEASWKITGSDLIIYESGVLTQNILNKLNNCNQLIIDAVKPENENNIVDLYVNSDVTINNKPVRIRGNIYIYLQEDYDITFNEGSPVIPTDDYLDKPLRTHLIGSGSGKNDVMIKSSFYGFISLGDPNNMGDTSNERKLSFELGPYGAYDKFHGLMLAQNLRINISPTWSDFVLVDRYDTSGGTGESTSGYTYAGIIK